MTGLWKNHECNCEDSCWVWSSDLGSRGGQHVEQTLIDHLKITDVFIV